MVVPGREMLAKRRPRGTCLVQIGLRADERGSLLASGWCAFLWLGELGARRDVGSLWVKAHFMLCFEAFCESVCWTKKSSSPDLLAQTGARRLRGHICGPWGPTALPASQGLQVGFQGLSPWEGGARSVGLGTVGGGMRLHGGSWGAATGAHERVFLGGSETLSPLARRCFLPSHRPQWLQALELPVPLSRLAQAAPRAPRGGDTCGKSAPGVDGCEQGAWPVWGSRCEILAFLLLRC